MDPITKIGWTPGMALENANGAVSEQALGYQYAIQTTTLIRSKVIEQKFYKIPFAELVPVEVGTGAFLEEIKTNLTYDAAGSFESGIIGTASGPTQLAQVNVGTSPKTATIVTWAKGYQYNLVELKKALASNNWDVVASKMKALKRNWDLGLQEVCFLGLKSNSKVPGLLSNSEVTVDDATTITKYIHTMSYSDFATFVQSLMAAYFSNSNSTELPDTFVIPMVDYLGLETPVSPQFPMVSMLDYLLKAFRSATMNPNFKIIGVAYCDQVNNVGYWTALGSNRYVLYRRDPETLKMEIPVDMVLNPAATADNFNWNGVGLGQFSGTVIYRVPEVLYFNWAA